MKANKHIKSCSTLLAIREMQIKTRIRDFLGGAMVKNPPANAGHMGSSPGPGRCHGATKPVRHNY